MIKKESSGLYIQKNKETINVKKMIINTHSTHRLSRILTRTLKILLP